jgi:N-succinyldiaminopimelate aminotransferase
MPEPPPSNPPATTAPGAFRRVPRTGVIYVMTEAARLGYTHGVDVGQAVTDADWCNLGQGQPDTGPLEGAPPRCTRFEVGPDAHEYAPVAGLWELREAVADFYNRTYRRGMPSRYAAENVSICGGGRASLTRTAASLGRLPAVLPHPHPPRGRARLHLLRRRPAA